MDILNIDPARLALSVVFGILVLVALFVLDARKIGDKDVRSSVYTNAACLLAVAIAAGWLTLQLSVSTCQPIPAATISAAVDRLMSLPADSATAAETAK